MECGLGRDQKSKSAVQSNKTVQIIGWIGNCFFVSGAAALAAGHVVASATLNAFGNVLYFSQSWITKNWSLSALSVTLGILSVIAAISWTNPH